MTIEPQYRLHELTTTGLEDWNENTPSMNKEECTQLYQNLLGDGMNPKRLKIVRVS